VDEVEDGPEVQAPSGREQVQGLQLFCVAVDEGHPRLPVIEVATLGLSEGLFHISSAGVARLAQTRLFCGQGRFGASGSPKPCPGQAAYHLLRRAREGRHRVDRRHRGHGEA